jgi:ABC-type transport system involved in multi-copper enzyme maturation permease subunit
VIATLVRVSWRRLFRGRALWVCAAIALLPLVVGGAFRTLGATKALIGAAELFVMTLLPPIFVASSIGEEIEDRTSTYLWSRPLARWTMPVAKLLALAPLASALVAGGWLLAIYSATGAPPGLQTVLALAAGALAISAMSAGVAMLVPNHGMSLSIVYLVIIDNAIGLIPASLQSISMTRQVRLLADFEHADSLVEPAVTIAILSAVWFVIGLSRLRRLEA